MKLSILFIAALLSVITFYQREVAILEWSNDTLAANVKAQHLIFQDCKRGVISHPLTWKWYQQ